MSDDVVYNLELKFKDSPLHSGFTRGQFQKLDGLYLRAASAKKLVYRTVECDFDEGVAVYTYYQSEQHSPYLQFIIRQVGPRTSMFEVFLQCKGRIVKSGMFEKAFARLQKEVEALIE